MWTSCRSKEVLRKAVVHATQCTFSLDAGLSANRKVGAEVGVRLETESRTRAKDGEARNRLSMERRGCYSALSIRRTSNLAIFSCTLPVCAARREYFVHATNWLPRLRPRKFHPFMRRKLQICERNCGHTVSLFMQALTGTQKYALQVVERASTIRGKRHLRTLRKGLPRA